MGAAGVLVRRLPIPRATVCRRRRRPAGRSPTRTRSAVDHRLTTEGHYPADASTLVATTIDDVRRDDDDVRRDGDGDRGDGDEADEADGVYDDDDARDDDDDDNHDVGDMCGCATSTTRRGLGTAAGKSARRAKSSCSVHRTSGVR